MSEKELERKVKDILREDFKSIYGRLSELEEDFEYWKDILVEKEKQLNKLEDHINFTDQDNKGAFEIAHKNEIRFRERIEELEKKIGEFDIGDFYNLRTMIRVLDKKDKIDELERSNKEV